MSYIVITDTAIINFLGIDKGQKFQVLRSYSYRDLSDVPVEIQSGVEILVNDKKVKVPDGCYRPVSFG